MAPAPAFSNFATLFLNQLNRSDKRKAGYRAIWSYMSATGSSPIAHGRCFIVHLLTNQPGLDDKLVRQQRGQNASGRNGTVGFSGKSSA